MNLSHFHNEINMRTLLFLILLSVLTPAQEITDLGTISPSQIIHLEKSERRTDFFRFKIEVLPRNESNTNKIAFTTTNDTITLQDLQAVPNGVAIMAIRSYHTNGDSSAIALFRIDVQRDLPDAPKAYVSHLLRKTTEQKVEHLLEEIFKEWIPEPPPLPSEVKTNRMMKVRGPEGARFVSPVPARSLPGGTNESYSQYLWRLEQTRMGRRRSQ